MLHADTSIFSEGGQPIALLKGAQFRVGERIEKMALLLVPCHHTGYDTRLFFERRLEGAGQSRNWKQHTLLGRSWWAPSWNKVPPSLPWGEMLYAHLRAVA